MAVRQSTTLAVSGKFSRLSENPTEFYAQRMNDLTEGRKRVPIRDLYPHFTAVELARAEHYFLAYIKAVLRVCEEIENDPKKRAHFADLTASRRNARMGSPSR